MKHSEINGDLDVSFEELMRLATSQPGTAALFELSLLSQKVNNVVLRQQGMANRPVFVASSNTVGNQNKGS